MEEQTYRLEWKPAPGTPTALSRIWRPVHLSGLTRDEAITEAAKQIRQRGVCRRTLRIRLEARAPKVGD